MKRITVDELEETLIDTLKSYGTKIYFIDEFQHTKGRNKEAIINMLKRSMLESRVPFIPVGMPNTLQILNLDDQLADRCKVEDFSHLTYWTLDDPTLADEFRKFLAGYEKFLPFPQPSNLSSKDMALKIFKKVEIRSWEKNSKGKYVKSPGTGKTNMRGIARFLKIVADNALKKDHERIEEEDIDSS